MKFDDLLKEEYERLLNESVKTVWVTKDPSSGEYRVPSPDGSEKGAYYTDDKEDAIGTAKNYMYKGKSINIRFKSKAHG
jgi:hypothetical protein